MNLMFLNLDNLARVFLVRNFIQLHLPVSPLLLFGTFLLMEIKIDAAY